MSKVWGVPKGEAIAEHLTPEYKEGQDAYNGMMSLDNNPYEFFGSEFKKSGAWSMGWQNARNTYMENMGMNLNERCEFLKKGGMKDVS